ncbi:MAG: tRNA (guanosine(37)-N1)-methyltransferase TrmD [Gemmatimonadota bacterium]|nr:tRNA (guanosine(37)-N1)-methyltransferase TrmD [Gemmatimonadota bacterium]MDP6528893.1 tRNA (guanosine(37)-N1)-methyltransferase TrmD [Gemmatimonadota bacterium]MDP6803254.1 tRNA (guanosine(37)-N1)-methyltransferase TrmD [Gemmatimonadota bacterium]MDP7032666.1 tRNA (guanosine(37)-N1)-methyltransferase TrmD [Gemmatimonadota bacterium]
MRFTVFTLFPDLIREGCRPSVLGQAVDKGVLSVETVDPREFSTDRHRSVDDLPFGGGAGMVLMPGPLSEALDGALEKESADEKPRVVFLSPGGRRFDQDVARDLAEESSVFLVCGRYKGIDERVRDRYATDEISIGDYVLSGGELAALVVIDAVMRLLPGALGDFASAEDDAIYSGLLSAPEYTRPRVFRGAEVPEVLVSGHHENVRRWRRQEALRRTLERRPDLLESADLSREDRRFLRELRSGRGSEELESGGDTRP